MALSRKCRDDGIMMCKLGAKRRKNKVEERSLNNNNQQNDDSGLDGRLRILKTVGNSVQGGGILSVT